MTTAHAARYRAMFGGVTLAIYPTKTDALDALYRFVNTRQFDMVQFAKSAETSELVSHFRGEAEYLSRVMGIMASELPRARRSPTRGRVVYQRDAFAVVREPRA